MIAATLPSSSVPSSHLDDPSRGDAFPSKAAWQKTKTSTIVSRPSPPLSPRAQGKQPQRTSPNESFIVLQDSVIRTIPTQPSSPTRPSKKNAPKTRNDANIAPNATIAKPLEPERDSPSPLSHHLRSTARLFNLLSTRTEIDHPLCAECTQILLTNLRKQLDETKKERDGYIAFEKEVRKEREREAQGITKEEASRKIEKLVQEEQLAIEQLREAEREREQLDEELRQLELDEKALEAEESEYVSSPSGAHSFGLTYVVRFWRSYNDQLLSVEQQNARLATLRAAYAADSATLERLEKTNVYNDAFCIGHDGVFGTINGLRLGRVPGVPVSDLGHSYLGIILTTIRWNGQRSMQHGGRRFYCCTPLPGNWTMLSNSE